MNTEKIAIIKNLLITSRKLESIPSEHREKISNSQCDKYAYTFGGDERFAVFKCSIFLDCHHGYYGNSSCSRLCNIDDKLAQELLNSVLNDMKDEILFKMSEKAKILAAKYEKGAREELLHLQQIIDEAVGEKSDNPDQ